ncbi:PilN domain-containing protein [Sulfuriferula thiophila]|uniref:PilN domain-containing protein n=1 Tax=Sulfuriferula thiophila TaxID=1781211 RepID=UPI000F60803B|nr:PilN domain-containing protein [Sulfuriferula thiophila]
MSQQINLCNPLFRKQEKYFSAVTMAQSLGLILLGCAVFYAYLAYQTRALTKQAGQMVQMHEAAQRQLTTLATTMAARKPDPLLTDAVAKAEQDVRARQVILDLLQQGELGNQTGFSEYFKALSRQTVSGLWLTGFEVIGNGNQITISGRALQPASVPLLIQHLKFEPVFAGVHFAALDMRHPDTPTTSTGTPGLPLPYIEFTLGNSKAEPAK